MFRPRSPATPRGSRIAVLVVVLVLTLGLIAVLAFEAYRADRSHRQVTEQVLHDYVRFAALELARHSGRELDAVASRLLDALACGSRNLSAAQAMEQLGTGGGGACPVVPPAAYVRFDPGRSEIVDAVGDLDDAAGAEIARALGALPRERFGGLLAIAAHDGASLLAWRRFGDGAAVPVHAIVIAEAAVAAIVEGILDSRPLLPKALVEPGAQRAYLTAGLRLAAGPQPDDAGDGLAPRFSASEPLEAANDGSVIAVASLAAGTADALIIGGLPRTRLPLLAALLFIATGLIAVAAHQLRREHELARLRDAFVSGVSHELRTPLAQIRLFAETLRLGRVRSTQETERSLAVIDEEAERLAHLVDNLLAFNRARRVSPSVTLEPLALGPFVSETVERFAPLVRDRRNRFVVEIPSGLTVQANRDAMGRALTNLLDNAVKYGSEGQLVRIAATDAAGLVRLTVDDEGSGVPGADRHRIWEPFVRAANGRSAVTGTGIGLSVVRDLMAAMGGRAWADDAPAGGGRFVLELRATPRPGIEGLEPSRAPA